MKNSTTERAERILYFTFDLPAAERAAAKAERILVDGSGGDYGYKVEVRGTGLENAMAAYEVVLSWNVRHVGGDPLVEALTLLVESFEVPA